MYNKRLFKDVQRSLDYNNEIYKKWNKDPQTYF